MNRNRGFTLVELLVVIAIIALLISLLLPALGKALRNGRSLKDGSQTKQIHQAMLSFAGNYKGKFPTPGLINRLPDAFLGNQPNVGDEDFSLNHTKNFYAAMIAQDFFPTVLLIGPTEVNTRVKNDEDYNFGAYNPSTDTYWDNNFSGVITNAECNTSYSHMAICGQRKKEKFRDSGSARDPIIGNRGPGTSGAVAVCNPGVQAYDKSPTLLLHDPKKIWDGNVCFNDNHTERLDSMYAALTTYEFEFDPPAKDNIYAAEFGGGAPATNHNESDAFLCMCNTSTETTVNPRFDTLLP
jgi:prepilin-type N-terminal cleavage/methylation domain-containing protein